MKILLALLGALLTIQLVAATPSAVIVKFCSGDQVCTGNCTSFRAPVGTCWQVPQSLGLGNVSFNFDCQEFPKCFGIEPFYGANCPAANAMPKSTAICDLCQGGIKTTCKGNYVKATNYSKEDCTGESNVFAEGTLGSCVPYNVSALPNVKLSIRAADHYAPCYQVNMKHAWNSDCSSPYNDSQMSGACGYGMSSNDVDYMLSFTCASKTAELDLLPGFEALTPAHFKALLQRQSRGSFPKL